MHFQSRNLALQPIQFRSLDGTLSPSVLQILRLRVSAEVRMPMPLRGIPVRFHLQSDPRNHGIAVARAQVRVNFHSQLPTILMA